MKALYIIITLVIISGDFGIHRICGFAPFGDKVIINTNPLCIERFGYDNLLKHELMHYNFFKLPKHIQIGYCDSLNSSYNYECWEEFADSVSPARRTK